MRRLQRRILLPASVAASTSLAKRLGVVGRFSSSGGNGSASATKAEPASPTHDEVLPGVDLAKRVADPSQAFPASWGSDEPLAPNDPRIMWKEHYSLAEERPYYHNVNTNETTYEIPEGFVTRFPKLYKHLGFTVDENGAVYRRSSTDSAEADGVSSGGNESVPDGEAGATKGKKLSRKQKLAAYGGGGLLWYLIVHNVCLATIFSLLYFFKVDLVAIARSYGFNVKLRRSEQVDEITEQTKHRPPFFKTLVLSVILNKLLVPIQLVFTLATAPLLVHRLEPVAMVLLPKCKAFFHSLKSKMMGTTP